MAGANRRKFPRTQKFLLGDRIQNAALDILENLIEATYSRRRQHHLAAANLALEKLRFLFRLGMDLRYLDLRKHEFAARSLDEGWEDPRIQTDPLVVYVTEFECISRIAGRTTQFERHTPLVLEEFTE